MEKIRDKKVAQLRWTIVYCPLHGRTKVPMLSPISCPGCDGERRDCNLLRRSKAKKLRRKYKGHELSGSMEEDGMD